MMPFQFSILKYAPDRFSGESLNLGVIVFDSSTGSAAIRALPSVVRLKGAYAGVNLNWVQHTLRDIKHVVKSWDGCLDQDCSLEALVKRDLPDQGLSLWLTEPSIYKAPSFTLAVDRAFERYVGSQSPSRTPRQRRDDAVVWDSFLDTAAVQPSLFEPAAFTLEGARVDFNHVFRNGKANVAEPITLDYSEGESLQRRFMVVSGRTRALIKSQQVNHVLWLIGDPPSPTMQKRAEIELNLALSIAESKRVHVVRESEAVKFGTLVQDILEHRLD